MMITWAGDTIKNCLCHETSVVMPVIKCLIENMREAKTLVSTSSSSSSEAGGEEKEEWMD